MAAPVKFNVFVGSETGLLKGVNTVSSKWENLNQISSANKENEIRSICLDSSDDSKLYFGTRSHKIFSYDFRNDCLVDKFQLKDCKGTLKSIRSYEENVITASDNGNVRILDSEGEILGDFSSGGNLCCMVQNLDIPNIIATGGKETNLKIWDINDTSKSIFDAKNVRNDWLNLQVPVWVLGAEFIPLSDKIVTCTGYHHVRVFDPKVQRRPVLEMTFDEYPITAISLCPLTDNCAIVGNSQGKMATVDFRKGKIVNIFKGFAGSIRDIKCHKTLPLVASCGLDRYIRIHDVQSKELKHKFYMKSRLNCLLFREDFDLSNKILDGKVPTGNYKNDKIATIEDEEIWSKMEVIETKTKRKGEHIEGNNVETLKKLEPSQKKKKKK
jgi:ribosome biogenesis protein NSA1